MAQETRSRFRDLAQLREGWDGRHAPPPTTETLRLAQQLLQSAAALQLEITRIAADPEGGVVLYLFGGEPQSDGGHSRHVGFVISNDDTSEVVVLRSERDGDDKVDVIAWGENELREALKGV